jgi:hypothetical protein
LQFLAFSEAYLFSATRLCTVLAASPAESSYPRIKVVSSLLFHGIELFLKAAILERVKNGKFLSKAGHNLERLYEKYTNLYPGKKYEFEIPFGYEPIVDASLDLCAVEELNSAITEHKKRNPADQTNRYPTNIEGMQWDSPSAFEPITFAGAINKAQQDVTHLKELIFHCPGSA